MIGSAYELGLNLRFSPHQMASTGEQERCLPSGSKGSAGEYGRQQYWSGFSPEGIIVQLLATARYWLVELAAREQYR